MNAAPQRVNAVATDATRVRAWMLQEAYAVRAAADRLDDELVARACGLLVGCTRLVAVTGVGVSGLVASKLAATFNSSGTPALYLHAGDALHGGLTVVRQGDVAIAVSKSGRTEETLRAVRTLHHEGTPVIALTGDADSPLAALADVVLDTLVTSEACPLGVSPTASSTAALAMGHALAMALAARRDWSLDDLSRVHPAGALGSLAREKQ